MFRLWYRFLKHSSVYVTSERSSEMIGQSPRLQRGSWARAYCWILSPGLQPRPALRSGASSVQVHRCCSGSGKQPDRLPAPQPLPSSPPPTPLPGSSYSWVSDERGSRWSPTAASSCFSGLPASLHRLGMLIGGAGLVPADRWQCWVGHPCTIPQALWSLWSLYRLTCDILPPCNHTNFTIFYSKFVWKLYSVPGWEGEEKKDCISKCLSQLNILETMVLMHRPI